MMMVWISADSVTLFSTQNCINKFSKCVVFKTIGFCSGSLLLSVNCDGKTQADFSVLIAIPV